MPYVDANGVRLYHQVLNPSGDRTVVMVHGLYTHHAVFWWCGARDLAERGYRVVLYDLRGHGLTMGRVDGFRLDDMCRDLMGLMDALAIEQACLVGYSFGGAIAVKAAWTAPDRFTGLVLIEAFGVNRANLVLTGDVESDVTKQLSVYAASTRLSVSMRAAVQVRQQVKRLLENGLFDDLLADADFFHSVNWQELTSRTLLVYGSDSPYLADGRLAAAGLPRGQLVVMKGDHNVVVQQTKAIASRLVDFCDTVGVVPATDGLVADHEGGEAVIRVDNLCMSYGRIQAVKSISFEVREGTFFAFLGANGAGKSTTINCLTTLRRPTSGQAWVAGHELGRSNDAIRRCIGVVFQQALLDPRLSVRENLVMRSRFHGLDKAEGAHRVGELTELLEMDSYIDRHYRLLSGGQKRRADIARALIHRPAVLFLDEPTAGLDPRSREQVWKAIADVRAHEGMTVFLTTHYMEETERADQVCIIESGQIVAQGTPSQLRQRYSMGELRLWVSQPSWATVADLLKQSFPRKSLAVPADVGEPIRLAVNSTDQVKALMPYVLNDIEDFEFRHGSMDDVFLSLTGHHGDDDEAPATRPAPRRQRLRGLVVSAKGGEA